ncbi:spore coat protein [Sporosarcina thermotolerans]|uniref:Spore coat protein n=1 Tax=Sporosarcina thermotolerans TaxID=633404 RepID=A0AAW9ABB5_9BACL|nr:spore coat protein [Sporosarcina thermotolerans]MDW0117893.1 spore coat protein [Sporosarcina thermotolerans]WHT49304.1 spore coat protein [Sporosarcina thermotolerans]
MGYKYNSRQKERWSALNSNAKHPMSLCSCGREEEEAAVEAKVTSDIDQLSQELIVIRDSCKVRVKTTDTQIAASLQAALQVAIAVVVNISIDDAVRAERVTIELLEKSQIKQTNRQKLIIVNSRDVEVITEDIDVAISLQLLLQILVAVIVQLDIL